MPFRVLAADGHVVFVRPTIGEATLRSAIRRKEGNPSGKWD